MGAGQLRRRCSFELADVGDTLAMVRRVIAL